jgi:hypothetical protein
MSHKYYFLIGQNVFTGIERPTTLFIYETENDDEVGKYTAYHRDSERQDYWNGWLERTYFVPAVFVNRFGYCSVWPGRLRDEDHFQELLTKIGIVNRDTDSGEDDNPPS